jgi:hypothetical protein
MQRDDRPDPYQRRYRLPFVRDFRAVFSWAIPSLGYGMSLAQRGGCRTETMAKRHDRHHGRRRLLAQRTDHTASASNLFNKGDGVLIVMQNGYAAARASNTSRPAQ